MTEQQKPRCEGWRRYGGAFTFGPVRWEQCKNLAVVTLTVVQDGITQDMPACMVCWQEALSNGIKVEAAVPIAAERNEGGN